MVVILDTTELYDSFNLDSAAFRLLEDFLRRTRSGLAISEIVIWETANHARKVAAEINKSLSDAKRQYDRLKLRGDSPISDAVFNEDDIENSCEQQLRASLASRFGANVLPLPQTSLSVLVRRSMTQEKPFQRSKDGLRDALIWDSIIELMINQPGDYAFITGNIRDFPSSPNGHLRQHVSGRTLQFHTDLRSFLDSHEGGLNALNDFAASLRESHQLGDFDLDDELSDLNHTVVDKISSRLRINASSLKNIEEPYFISDTGAAEDIEVSAVFGLPEEIVIQCGATYDCSVTGYANKFDAFNSDELYVTDPHWNEHYAEVEFSLDIRVKFLITLKADERHPEPEDDGSYEVSAVEVEDVQDITTDH